MMDFHRETYDSAWIGELMLWADRDGLNKELVLALGIEGWLGFHCLEEYYMIHSVLCTSCVYLSRPYR